MFSVMIFSDVFWSLRLLAENEPDRDPDMTAAEIEPRIKLSFDELTHDVLVMSISAHAQTGMVVNL